MNDTEFNNTPASERIHIGFFGKVNSGKSSLMNAVASQDISIVSDIKGTTTDPVRKSMELLPLGSVMLYDTAGYEDDSAAGELRIKKTLEILRKTDIAVLVSDSGDFSESTDREFINEFERLNIPYVLVHSKADLYKTKWDYKENEISVSAKTGAGLEELKKLICSIYLNSREDGKPLSLTEGLAGKESLVVLVTPIDASAPKGRLILPQVQTLRSLLDSFAITVTVQLSELQGALKLLNRAPDLVITDSQVFSYVKDIVAESVPLTSFSILFARYKGILTQALEGIEKLKSLNDGDTVLIAEGCTHHRQCGDIGRDKLPLWINKFTGKNIFYEFTSGGEFPKDTSKYSLIVHCGGCMLNNREMEYRRLSAKTRGTPFTNFGILIAAVNGILERCTEFIKK